MGEIPPKGLMYKNAFKMAWPCALEEALISLVSSIDTMMVGVVGTNAIAAVGIVSQPRYIFLAFIFAINMGVTAVVARRCGQEDKDGANRALRQGLMISAVLTLILTAVAMVVARPLIAFAGAEEIILDDAVAYFRIVMASFFFSGLSMVINAAQRGVGNTKLSMYCNVTANIVNIIFNYLLIGGNLGFPKMGIRGAAIATSIGFFVGFCISLSSLFKKGKFLEVSIKDKWTFDRATMSSLTMVTVSAAIEQLFMRIGFFFTSKVVASLGTTAYATHQIGMNLVNFSFAFGTGFGTAASSLSGQNLGKERPDLSKCYVFCCHRMTMVICILLSILFVFGGGGIYRLYTSDQWVIKTGRIISMLIAVICYLQTSNVIYTGCLRGAGDTRFTARVSMFSIAILRPVATWAFCYPLGMGVVGAWCGMLVDQFFRLVCSNARFRGGEWAKIHL